MDFPSQYVLSKVEIEESEVFAPRFDAPGSSPPSPSKPERHRADAGAHERRGAGADARNRRVMHYYSRSRARDLEEGRDLGRTPEARRDAHRLRPGRDSLRLSSRPGHGARLPHRAARPAFTGASWSRGAASGLHPTGEAPLFDPEAVYGRSDSSARSSVVRRRRLALAASGPDGRLMSSTCSPRRARWRLSASICLELLGERRVQVLDDLVLIGERRFERLERASRRFSRLMPPSGLRAGEQRGSRRQSRRDAPARRSRHRCRRNSGRSGRRRR